MDLFIFLIQQTAIAVLNVIDLALLLRAIFSWIPMEENGFTELLHRVTEPIIYPFRWILYKLNLFQSFPLDMAYFFAVITVSLTLFGLSALG